MASRTRHCTAIHEAGHAVAAYWLKVGFNRASVEPDDDSLGHVLMEEFSETFRPDLNNDDQTRLKGEKRIVIKFAGPAAEAKNRGRNNWRGAQSDLANSSNLALYFCGSSDEASAYLEWLRLRATSLVRKPELWYAIQKLAGALEVSTVLTGTRARGIIRKALKEFFARRIAAKR